MKHHILLVDDDALFRSAMTMFLNDEGFDVTAATSGDEAIARVRQGIENYSLALVDYHMPELSGSETIGALKECDPSLIVYTFSGDDSDEAFQKSLSSGAVFFIQKDISIEKLLGLIHRACVDVEARTKFIKPGTPTENQKLIESIQMVGVSDHMADVTRMVLTFAPHNEAVLIRGENGTGKEKVARAIHNKSPRSKQPFIAVNTTAITETLLESELFGYTKGAFSGAAKNKVGLFEAANGGTIFLDEIGDFPKHLQPKLLRVLQEKQITPVGSTVPVPVDFRLITATNAKLEDMINDGRFREDLYYRINVFPILLKPLRDRPEDIPALALSFLEQFNLECKENKKLLKSSVEKLKKLYWQGNIRELQQAIRLLVATAIDDTINVDPFIKTKKSHQQSVFDQFASLKAVTPDYEKKAMNKALIDGGSVAAASRLLSMSRTTFRDRMKKYKIEFEKLTK